MSNWPRIIPYQAHPWHGITPGEGVPEEVNAFIEIVPTDTVKYEIDKASGHLKVDRPQKFSNLCPTLYGFIPQTYCGIEVGLFCGMKTDRTGIIGDGDPLDICVLSDRPMTHGNLLMTAIPIGGVRMIDAQQADDKIIAVLKNDPLYGHWRNIEECPLPVIERLRHYFLTYKDMPGTTGRRVELTHVYSAKEAHEVIRASLVDYRTLTAGKES
jgi:inorganic pyrophosphatase